MLEVGKEFYSIAIERVVTVTSPRVAEMTKLLENIHRAVNIGLVNEMKTVADQMGIDIFFEVDAAATKPFASILPRSRAGRTLYSGRSILPDLESARIWHPYQVYRAFRGITRQCHLMFLGN